jgi:hypothetical protein
MVNTIEEISPCQLSVLLFDEIPALYSSLSRNQDSVVGIATGYGLDDRGVRFLVLVG